MRRVSRFVVLVAGIGVVLASLLAPADAQSTGPVAAPGTEVVIRSSDRSVASYVAPDRTARRSAQSAAFVVNYDAGFQANPRARAAFQYAVDIWSAQLTSSVPIVVDAQWRPLEQGVLGSAGPAAFYRDFPNAPRPATFYAIAAANKLRGADLAPGESDIVARFSSSASWYFGLDGRAPSNQHDFVSVVLHEIGHGLGFVGSASVVSGRGYHGVGVGYPLAYDWLVFDGAGVSPLAFLSGTGALARYLTSNNLYWAGANAVAANGGWWPRLYAPGTWDDGSSYSHLSEVTYPEGDANSLMTPQLSRGEAIHDPGPIARGMLSDLGWSTSAARPTTATPTPTVAPTATPIPSSGSESVLFRDDFTTYRGWYEGYSSDFVGYTSRSNGGLNLRVLAADRTWWAIAPVRLATQDATVDVDVRIGRGDAGIVFGATPGSTSSFYLFQLSPGSDWTSLWRYSRATGWVRLGQTYAVAYRSGTNQLRVRRAGGEISASVNGTAALSATDYALSGTGVGVYLQSRPLESSADATFYNFVVSGAAAPTSTPTPRACSAYPSPGYPSPGSGTCTTPTPLPTATPTVTPTRTPVATAGANRVLVPAVSRDGQAPPCTPTAYPAPGTSTCRSLTGSGSSVPPNRSD